MSKILVTGSSHGLGCALVNLLQSTGHNVIEYDRDQGDDVRYPDVRHIDELDVLINCAGVNHIDWLEKFEEARWDEVMDTNAKGIYMMTRALLPQLIASKGTVLNIISNASHMPMTCSLAYNASKGAAHIMTLQLARELTKKYGITVFGISPNKLAGTEMSNSIEQQVCSTRNWTKSYAETYQRNALLTGEETSVAVLAEFICFLLHSKRNHKFLSGCVIPYGA